MVEAEDPIRETLVEAMVAEGHEVITASNGHAALTLLQRLTLNQEQFFFDLIIFAGMLPQVDGLELCRWLRCQGNFVPTLVLSPKENEADSSRILAAGADDCLSKPFNTLELTARCRALLRRHDLSFLLEPQVLQFEEVSLYPREYRVLVRGEEVKLPPKEFRLLELFMSHPGRVWSRQQLLKQLWAPNFAGGTKNVDVHIRKLRQKLELSPEQPKYIVTVWRVGYRFG